ncbi:ATP-NAD kinase-like domain [Pseudocohnilembus persalinus]|uniref:diacylglycerol kinase (ATP) n=1 Tax=Pseudocohnilembus persalinus TaxID=266149 RepID=A0A0V0QYV7_PSEPJ|nr:ATP-NAD kinase-like domain [Pseudocohnilembus persalinus]|eukprot:KRX07080.1 ATP-NAD kinase-like domain [Pseudocohnilembus persalinus]
MDIQQQQQQQKSGQDLNQKHQIFQDNFDFFFFVNTSSTNGFQVAKNFLTKEKNNDQQLQQQEKQFQEVPQFEEQQNGETENEMQEILYEHKVQHNLNEIRFQFPKKKNRNLKDKQDKIFVNVYFVDLLNKVQKQKGFQLMKQKEEEKYSQVRAVVCGGDGSIIWVIDEMINAKIQVANVAISAIAIGTGNDFCRAMGWGTETFDSIGGETLNMSLLKNLVDKMINSQIQDLDIWDIEIETGRDGYFQQIKGQNCKRKKMKLKDENGKIKNKIKHHMVNYFSIGLDAQIGFNFDNYRTNFRCINKLVYCWQGFKKLFVKKLRVDKILDSFKMKKTKKQKGKGKIVRLIFYVKEFLNYEIDEITDIDTQNTTQISKQSTDENNKNNLDNQHGHEHHCIFKSSEYMKRKEYQNLDIEQQQQEQEENGGHRYLTGDPINLICCNISSYCAGAQDIWGNCGNSGLQNKEKIRYNQNNEPFKESHHGDGQLEFMTFRNILEFIIERYKGGNGSRITQGSGPYEILFKEKDEDGKSIFTYFQIDGEYYKIIEPKMIKISHTQDVIGGKIKVMVNTEKAIKQKFQKFA